MTLSSKLEKNKLFQRNNVPSETFLSKRFTVQCSSMLYPSTAYRSLARAAVRSPVKKQPSHCCGIPQPIRPKITNNPKYRIVAHSDIQAKFLTWNTKVVSRKKNSSPMDLQLCAGWKCALQPTTLHCYYYNLLLHYYNHCLLAAAI